MNHSKPSYKQDSIHGISTVLYVLSGIILVALFFPLKVAAQGDLLITPRRIVFDGKKRTQQINLANTGNDTATYLVSFKQYRMLEDGSFEEITEPDPGQYFASDHLRFFPRSVTLAPKEAQMVKLQLARTKNLPEGEYRSHIYFRAVPKPVPLGEKDQSKDTSNISIRLTPIFGITIPVIFRVGATSAEVTLSDLSLDLSDAENPKLNVTFNRTGNQSVYGHLKVQHVSADGKVTDAGIVKGIAVYTPNTVRHFQMTLTNKDVNYQTGKLIVTYETASDVNPETMAEAELMLH